MKPKNNLCTECRKEPYTIKDVNPNQRTIWMCSDCEHKYKKARWSVYNKKHYKKYIEKESELNKQAYKEMLEVKKLSSYPNFIKAPMGKADKVLRKLIQEWQ